MRPPWGGDRGRRGAEIRAVPSKNLVIVLRDPHRAPSSILPDAAWPEMVAACTCFSCRTGERILGRQGHSPRWAGLDVYPQGSVCSVAAVSLKWPLRGSPSEGPTTDGTIRFILRLVPGMRPEYGGFLFSGTSLRDFALGQSSSRPSLTTHHRKLQTHLRRNKSRFPKPVVCGLFSP